MCLAWYLTQETYNLKKGEDDKHIKKYMNNLNSENKKYEKNKIASWVRKRQGEEAVQSLGKAAVKR